MFDLVLGHDEQVTDDLCRDTCDCEINNNNCRAPTTVVQTTQTTASPHTHKPHPSHPTHPPHGGAVPLSKRTPFPFKDWRI